MKKCLYLVSFSVPLKKELLSAGLPPLKSKPIILMVLIMYTLVILEQSWCKKRWNSPGQETTLLEEKKGLSNYS